MANLHVIEERKAGAWTFYRLAKDADDAAKGVAAMRLANPEWEVRAAEYVLTRRVFINEYFSQYRDHWCRQNSEYYATADDARVDLARGRAAYPTLTWRIVRLSDVEESAQATVVETFAPKGGV